MCLFGLYSFSHQSCTPVHSFFETEAILENPLQIFTNLFFGNDIPAGNKSLLRDFFRVWAVAWHLHLGPRTVTPVDSEGIFDYQ